MNWFKRIIAAVKEFFGGRDQRPDEPIPPAKPIGEEGARERLWNTALALEGKVKEYPGDKHNPVIVDMFKVVTGKVYSDETPWCAAAVGYLLNKIGLSHTGSLVARSYLNYGNKIDLADAKQGDIVIFKRGNSSWQGHVGLYSYRNGDYIEVLGGNQQNAFNKRRYQTEDLLGVRRVEDAKVEVGEVKNHFDGVNLGEYFQSFLEEMAAELSDLEPGDVGRYFPAYKQADRLTRIEFWKFFLSCMAKKESGVNPDTQYRENFKVGFGPRKNEYVISRGLFQLSIDSVNLYKNHGAPFISSPQSLHNPLINLEAAVAILTRWIKKDGVISGTSPNRGGARYWSVLRKNSNHNWIINECLKTFTKA